MIELVRENWWLFAIALLIGIAVAWWIFVANRKTRVERSPKTDVLDEGAAPAARNQALIDAPTKPAAPTPPPAAEPAPAPAAAPEPAAPPPAAPPAAAGADDLKRIKGVGPKLEKLLHSLGVTSYAQIAEWSEADIDRVDAQLGKFEGRIRRDSWIEQAKLLAAGDTASFEGKFGSL